MRTCSPSPPLNLQLRARPTPLSTGAFPFRGARVASSRTTASSSSPGFRTPSGELLGVRKTATRSYHPSSNGGVKRVNQTMAQMLGCGRQRTSRRLGCTVASRGVRLQQFGQRRHWPASQRGSHGQRASVLLFRPLRGRRVSEPGRRPSRILRPGVGTPTARQRYCLRYACLDSFPC